LVWLKLCLVVRGIVVSFLLLLVRAIMLLPVLLDQEVFPHLCLFLVQVVLSSLPTTFLTQGLLVLMLVLRTDEFGVFVRN
jgi:hypothetical protein